MSATYETTSLFGSANGGGSGPGFAVAAPAPISAGNLWLVIAWADIGTPGAGTLELAGFTPVTTTLFAGTGYPALRVWKKIAGASESDVTVTRAAADLWASCHASIRISGSNLDVLDVQIAYGAAAGATTDAPAVTVPVDDCVVICVAAQGGNSGSITEPANATTLIGEYTDWAAGSMSRADADTGAFDPGVWTFGNANQDGAVAVTIVVGTSGSAAQTVSGVGNIASAEAHGTPTITRAGVSITGAGNIASAEAFGAATVARGAVSITGAGGIATAENFFSSPTSQAVRWAAVAGASGYRIKWGTAPGGPYATGSADVGNVTNYPLSWLALTSGSVYYLIVVALDGSTEGTASPELRVVPGAAVVEARLTAIPAGIASAEAFGAPTVVRAAGGTVLTGVGAIASAEAFGTATLVPGVRTLIGLGAIASGEAFGSAVLAQAGGVQTLSGLGGIASQEAFGVTRIVGGVPPTKRRRRRVVRLNDRIVPR
jgi:hypothetical protein